MLKQLWQTQSAGLRAGLDEQDSADVSRSAELRCKPHLKLSYVGLKLISGGVAAARVVVGPALHRADLLEGCRLVERRRNSAVWVAGYLRRVQQPGRQAPAPGAPCLDRRFAPRWPCIGSGMMTTAQLLPDGPAQGVAS